MTRENFYKLKNKLAEARLLTMQRRNSDSTQNVFGEDNESKSQASSLDSEEPAKGRFMVSWNIKKSFQHLTMFFIHFIEATISKKYAY